jgi:hypothetical protein
VIGDALAKFRHDLKVFQTFEIHTRVIGWDSKWVFFEHRFVRKDRVIGVVAGHAVLKAQSGPIDLQIVSAELGHSAPSPELPEWAKRFDQGAELLSERIRDEERSKGHRTRYVRLGSKADIAKLSDHVSFTPIADIPQRGVSQVTLV